MCSGDQSDADCIDDWINGDFISGSPQKDESEKVEADSAERPYVFYGLLYVHIMLINIPYARMGLHMYAVNVLVYSIVFAGYAAMRIRKWVLTKNPGCRQHFYKESQCGSICVCSACVYCGIFNVFYAERK